MVFAVVAEVETGQQRGDHAEITAARAMLVGERVVLVPVRQVGAEVEQLKRGQDRRHRPEQQQVTKWRAEQEDSK